MVSIRHLQDRVRSSWCLDGLFAGVEAPKRLIVNHLGLGGQAVRERSGVVGNSCGEDVFPSLRFDSITLTELPEFWQFVLEIGRITQRTFSTGFTADVAGPNSGGRRKMNEGRVGCGLPFLIARHRFSTRCSSCSSCAFDASRLRIVALHMLGSRTATSYRMLDPVAEKGTFSLVMRSDTRRIH